MKKNCGSVCSPGNSIHHPTCGNRLGSSLSTHQLILRLESIHRLGASKITGSLKK